MGDDVGSQLTCVVLQIGALSSTLFPTIVTKESKMPAIFSKLSVPLTFAYGLQVGAACLFVPMQTEKYFDLTGATGHLVSAFASLYGPSVYQHFKAGGAISSFRLPPVNVGWLILIATLMLTFAADICSQATRHYICLGCLGS